MVAGSFELFKNCWSFLTSYPIQECPLESLWPVVTPNPLECFPWEGSLHWEAAPSITGQLQPILDLLSRNVFSVVSRVTPRDCVPISNLFHLSLASCLPGVPRQRLQIKVPEQWRGQDQPGLVQNAPVGRKVGATCHVLNISTGRGSNN